MKTPIQAYQDFDEIIAKGIESPNMETSNYTVQCVFEAIDYCADEIEGLSYVLCHVAGIIQSLAIGVMPLIVLCVIVLGTHLLFHNRYKKVVEFVIPLIVAMALIFASHMAADFFYPYNSSNLARHVNQLLSR